MASARRAARAGAILVAFLGLVAVALWWVMIRMPGHSYRDAPLPLPPAGVELARGLRADTSHLASAIGPRHAGRRDALAAAAAWIEARLEQAGLPVERQSFEAAGGTYANVEATLRGHARAREIVVVGAHYDTVPGSPGADDNASGVAALLALADRLAGAELPRTVRFVAFANEEQPFFASEGMGSRVYAARSRRRDERIVAMISLESIGYYRDDDGSQGYPFPLGLLYPSRGDFLGFVGNLASRELVRAALAAFRDHARLPSEGAALPAWVPGVGWSDHRAFWEAGYPALMVTDTAPFRNPHYHTPGDTPKTLDYTRLARAVTALAPTVRALATP